MTSKEALKDISYLLLNEVDDLKNKDVWQNNIGIIEKDLELLEILKKYLSIKSYTPYEIPELIILSGNEIKDKEEAKTIKEWLENDKCRKTCRTLPLDNLYSFRVPRLCRHRFSNRRPSFHDSRKKSPRKKIKKEDK